MTSTQDEQHGRQRLEAIRDGASFSQVYGPEWCFDMADQFRADLTNALASLPAPDTAGEVVASDEYATLIAAGFGDYEAKCALRAGADGGFCHAYFYSDGQWRFQTGGGDLHLPDGKVLQCVLTKRLYAAPQSIECTPGYHRRPPEPQAPATGGAAAFLRDLARRMRDVPAVHIDGGDIDELLRIAATLTGGAEGEGV